MLYTVSVATGIDGAPECAGMRQHTMARDGSAPVLVPTFENPEFAGLLRQVGKLEHSCGLAPFNVTYVCDLAIS